MRVKTSLLLDEALWRLFKARVTKERGLRGLSEAVEEAIREELCDIEVAEALSKLAGDEIAALDVEPVKPLTETSAAQAVRELRESRL
ncbi:MAG: hypothetical protein QXU69_03360 [Thermofilaceae archaeon]